MPEDGTKDAGTGCPKGDAMRRPMPRPGAEDKAGSHITSHPFKPRKEWYGACETCNLAESAHRDTLLERDERGQVLNPSGPYAE